MGIKYKVIDINKFGYKTVKPRLWFHAYCMGKYYLWRLTHFKVRYSRGKIRFINRNGIEV